MADTYAQYLPDWSAPCSHAAAITPDDDTDLDYVTRAIYVGTTGTLKVTTAAGDVVELTSVPAGLLPIRVRRVWVVSESAAANLVALW